MAVALLGKCVALLGLVVLFYATCYGFRIRDVLPQTHPAVCIPAHGRTCSADKTATTTTATGGPMYLARKWHENTVLRTIAAGRKPPAELLSKTLEKVRLADKDKAKISFSKHNIEKSEQDDKKLADTKPAVESVKQSIVSTKQPIEITKKSTADTKKPVEDVKKLSESTKTVESIKPTAKSKTEATKVESIKTTTKSKTEATKVVTKSDEKSKTSMKLEASTPALKTKDQSKQPKTEKVDVKKVTKSIPKSLKTVSQVEKQETKPKPMKRTDVSVTLSELNDAILRVSTFVPNFTNVESLECQQHGKIFLRQLRGYKFWALQMLDSSAKIPSNLLRGNVNQLGDYDQCLGVLAHVKVDKKPIRIQGKYCLAAVDMHASHPDMKLPVNLMQARAFIRGNMHDPGHLIPKFTTVNWALCLPAACSAKDAKHTLENALKDYNETVGITFTVNVDPDMCYVKQKSQIYSKETIGVLYFYAMIICLVIVATIRDYFVDMRGKGNYSERIIMSFSLRRTIKALLKRTASATDITCIHGIRVLATIALYIGHQLIVISRIPFSNRTSFTEIANNPVTSILRVSLVYTDAFLLLSGVLTAYNMAQELKTRGEIRWFCRFIARFIRLTPALLAVVFWYAFVMEHLGSGPLWNSIIIPNAELCKCNAWTNLLYVQNFFPFEEMCATHTHQLALDMQLSLLAPMLVFFLQYKPLIGILLMVFFILLSATLRYIATVNNYLSFVIFHGISLKRLYKTANLSYALPLHRATPYISGVGLGVLLHYTGKNVKIHKMLVILGWLIATALGSWSLFSPWRQARRDYVYDAEEAAHYAVIGPVSWAAALCWLIFACFTEHGGVINRFLSNHWLVIFSRISYAVYLSQFAVFFYNVATTRYSTEFQLHRAIDPLEVMVVIVASVVLTLFLDFPMQEIKSVIMESTDGSTLETFEEKKINANESKSVELTDPVKITGNQTNNVFEDDEVASTGWDWQRDITHGAIILEGHDTEEEIMDMPLKKVNGRRTSFIDHETYDSEEISSKNRNEIVGRKLSKDTKDYTERGRRNINSQRYMTDDSEEEAIEFLRSQREYNVTSQRNRRSLSKTKENKRLSSKESEDEEEWRHRRENEDGSKQFRKSEISSESEEELSPQQKLKPERISSSDARTSDEEEWEHELRIRRKEFMEKLIAQQRESLVETDNRETDAESLKRRSSAEGRIALLRDDLSGEDNMDSWTVKSKRESLQDLSKLLPEELAISGWNVIKREGDLLTKPTSAGLFKRESIVKSQASEEDPEYLLPERPKLIQQEREHPFKKAWQMQKSRSEEEGSSAYTIKEPKEQQCETKSKEQELPHKRNGEQSEDMQSFAEEVEAIVMLQSRSSDTEDSKISSKSSTDFDMDSISIENSRATFEGDHRQNSKSETDEDSAKFNWPDEEEEDETYRTGHRRKSEEADWNWEQEET
ncbi:Nose resistant to fluoxetine protein [Ooceraea biroi]|uniref:Nose resistant to fluoxetine protein n=1 Tax=Ooceraea biroi TaxID=2015173 RepID=A0A026W6X6_OOCBI|nr:Nose resistant to fluoxetine protein [Ooceraea biroi]